MMGFSWHDASGFLLHLDASPDHNRLIMQDLSQKLRAASSLGMFSKTTDSAFVEAAGLAGLDFMILDMEHGPVSWARLHDHVRAARVAGMASIVRVPELNANLIGSALDSGANGVQVPNISTREEAQQAVSAARFFPHGERGVCRFVRAAGYGSRSGEDYLSSSTEPVIVLQVEGVEGAGNIDQILDVEGFDVLFVGPYDLSQSAGKPGQIDAPEVIQLMRRVASAANNKNKILGSFADNPRGADFLRKEGFRYIAYGVDVDIFRNACERLIREGHD
jgi:4-hydroxy-2-oxoheptanedioate aldolase